MTINVSHLWRHEEQWDALGNDDPARARPQRAASAAGAPARSYGAEAYTLAAVCRDSIPTRGSRSTAPTSTGGWWSAPATGVFSVEDARTAPQALLRALVRRRR